MKTPFYSGRSPLRLPSTKRLTAALALLLGLAVPAAEAQTVAFPGAGGFGRFATGARGAAARQVYVVTNLNDSGPGSFRDAVSQPGRVVTFAVGGVVHLVSNVQVAPNVTIAGQTAPGDGIVFFNKRITFTGASNTICRYLRVRLGATANSGNDASGLANGSNIILDHMSFSWGMDEVFSINWDGKGTAPDNITVQNSIIGQGLHRENHSAGGLIQTPDGGKVSLLRNLYISNKTRNPKVKGVNEFVNNVVYDWGNGNRLGNQMNYGWSGDAYIMGGSSGVSEVNIINNYFVGGPLTPPNKTTPFSRGTGTFYLYGAGNYFDNNRNGVLDGAPVPYDTLGYPGIVGAGFRSQAFPYPAANPALSASQAYEWVIDSVGANYPRRDQVDNLMVDEVRSRGTQGLYVYTETDLPFANGGLGNVFGAPTRLDSDHDGMPDAWEDAHGLNKHDAADAVAFSTADARYLNVEVYVNSLTSTPAPAFVRPPSGVQLSASSFEVPAPGSRVALTWLDNTTDETRFVLERSADGVAFAAIAYPAADATAFTDSVGLQPNTTYYYRLKAETAAEASAYTAVASIRTPALPTAPVAASAPSPSDAFQYAETTAGKITLRWTGSANTLQYVVNFGTSPTALRPVATLPYSATASYEVDSLADLATYYWRIDALNSRGQADGPVWSFRTTQAIVPQLVGHWGFDETAADGTQITDQSTFANHGVLGLDDDDASIRVPGKVNNALNFATADPSRYVVSIPHQDQLYLDRNSFSLAFWMKADPATLPQTNNQSAYLLCKGSITRNAATGATGKRFDIEFKNRQLRFAIDDDVNKDELQTDGTVFYSGSWVHVVAIRDVPNKKLLVYLNGSLVKEIPTKANGIGEESALVVGNIGELEFLSSANAPAPYTGLLDELKVFNYPLSAQEIMQLRAPGPLPLQAFNPSIANNALLEGFGAVPARWLGGYQTDTYKVYLGSSATSLNYAGDVAVADAAFTFQNLTANTTYFWRVDAVNALGTTAGDVWTFRTGNPRGLVAHYKLDEAAGLVATDHSAFQHNGALVGMATSAWTSSGKFDGSLHFGAPASTGGVTVPDAPQLRFDQNSFTASLWVKIPANTYTSSNAKDTYLFHKGTFEAGTGKWYGLQLRDGVLTFSTDDGSIKTDAAVRVSAAPYNLFNDQWQHLVAVRDVDSKTMKLYVNGVLAATKAYTTGTLGKANDLRLGNSAENKPYRDLMDDVRFYNYALSTIEIADLAKYEQTISFAALPAYLIGDADFALTATASSGLPVSYVSSDESVATIANGTVVMVGPGTAVITASQAGDATYLAAAPVSQTLTVAPLLVKVRHQDGDNGRLTNNVIRPNLTLTNEGNVSVAYSELTARYWLTAENDAGLNAFIDYAQLGTGRVQARYVRLAQPRQGAYGYVEYSFDPAAGTLASGGGSGIIRSRLANQDWAPLSEADDYSYAANSAFALNPHVTLYRNGRLAWGQEPAAVPATTVVKVLTSNRNQNPGSRTISTYLSVVNEGNQPLNYADLTVRYWFSPEGTAGLAHFVDYARLGAANVTGQFGTGNAAVPGAEAYLELGFAPATGMLYPLSSSGNVQYRIAKADWSRFAEANDYSYLPAGPLAENSRVTVYYQGQLIYGTEPAATSARAAAAPSSTAAGLDVMLLENPVASSEVAVAIRGAEGQPLDIVLLDLQGNAVASQHIRQAGVSQHAQLLLAKARPGVYLLRVVSADKTAVVRLLRE